MTIFHQNKDIEKKLRQAAGHMPEPTKPLPLSPIMKKRCQAERTHSSHRLGAYLWRTPAWRIAVITLLVFVGGSTTIFAASPKLRSAIAHIFSSGITETIPIDKLESEEPALDADVSNTAEDALDTLSGNITRQTVGSLTLVQDVTLDSHFTASYASSSDYLALVKTPSGTPLFQTREEDGKSKYTYYSVTGGNLEEIKLKTHTLTAAVRPGILPGIMNHRGDTKFYRNLTFPTMEFTVNWQQYGSDVLIDASECGVDSGSTYGADLENDYDGQFECQALAGKEDIIQVLFFVDAQQTDYQYPFLLNLKTGEVSDPLALVDLSDWACITELSIHPDLTTATAMAGSSHEDLQEITIDLNACTVSVEADSPAKPPTDDCFIWFSVTSDTIFYVTGTEEGGDGYLYNTQNRKSTLLFTDAADYSLWENSSSSSPRYWESIGYGYLVYYADETVSLINLQDGGTMTVLEDIPMRQNIDFFMNNEGTVLSISTHADEDSFETARLCLMDLKTMEAWYFDRNLPEGVEEESHSWNSEYGYVIEAENTETGTNYVYLYQYTP